MNEIIRKFMGLGNKGLANYQAYLKNQQSKRQSLITNPGDIV